MKKASMKRLRFGGTALAITLLVVCAAVLLNVIASMLAARYDWMYLNMNTDTVYSISEDCRDYIKEYVVPEVDRANAEQATDRKIRIIFADTERNIKADERLSQIYDSIAELKEAFPQYIETAHINIWEDPSGAREYGISSVGDIVCEFGSRYETVNFEDFYLTDPADPSVAVAYNGEKILASCLMRVTQENTPNCYFTVNHGEDVNNTALMRIMIEAGYNVNFLDLSEKEIPADCELLVTYDPERDATVSGGGRGEIEKLDEYMLGGGRYMVFISADTFAAGAHENFEALLEDWGVKFMHKTSADGIEQSYLIRDTQNSLSVDGYTVMARNATDGRGVNALSHANYPCVFGNSTCIEFAGGFTSDGNGNMYKTQNGATKTVSPLLITHESAQAWMGGIAVARADEDPFTLMSMTSCESERGKGYLVACASTDFASQERLGAAVLGNGRAITEIIRYMGRDNAPSSIMFKSFGGSEIESLTTSVANTYTLLLALVPTLAVAACGIVILVRRKHL